MLTVLRDNYFMTLSHTMPGVIVNSPAPLILSYTLSISSVNSSGPLTLPNALSGVTVRSVDHGP
jgi:hypothetical protein